MGSAESANTHAIVVMGFFLSKNTTVMMAKKFKTSNMLIMIPIMYNLLGVDFMDFIACTSPYVKLIKNIVGGEFFAV